MKNILRKELRLSASPLTFWFLIASVLTFAPGYPIQLSAFFICLGIFYSFQAMRENNDLNYSFLLPITKKDYVFGKFAFSLIIEVTGFAFCTAFTLIRMAFLCDAAPYVSNALMGANFVYLGWLLVIFGVFNLVFINGFFKTAYGIVKPFILFCVFTFSVVTVSEILWHIPGAEFLNSLSFNNIYAQLAVMLAGIVLFTVMTYAAFKTSVRNFEKADL